MDFLSFIKEECIQIGGTFPDKESVLKTITALVKKNNAAASLSEEKILAGLKQREALGSTGFGNGIGIPHAAFENLENFIVGMLISEDGFPFEALDNQPSKLLVFIMVPESKRNQHIRLLSKISNVLKDPENVSEILKTKTASAAKESFLRNTIIEETEDRKENNLFQVIIQNEDQFDDILNVFTEINCGGISVIESNNARAYLYSLPLFSSFWNREDKGFSRIIIASVSKSLSNEVIRKLNMLIDDSKDKTGILFTVQEMFYTNGSLNI